MKRVGFFIVMLWLPACVELDFFLFEGESATSVADDYYGLPLIQVSADVAGTTGFHNIEAERHIYLSPNGDSPNDRSSIHGVFLPAPLDCPLELCPLRDAQVTVLYQHGNSGDLFQYWHRAVALWAAGVTVFIYSYRGYGLSSGEATRATVLADSEAAMAYLMSRSDVNQSRIVAYGYSMGAIPASYLVGASRYRDIFAGLILEAPLDSPASTANLSTGTAWPSGFFLDASTTFDGPAFMKNADLPVLHMHGMNDERVPPIQSASYRKVLIDRADYTSLAAPSSHPDWKWIERTHHGNIPCHVLTFSGSISRFFDDPRNPGRCCIHPAEYRDDINREFLDTVAGTDGERAYDAYLDYQATIVRWIETIVSLSLPADQEHQAQ